MGLISDDAKEIILEKVKEFHLSDEDLNTRIQMRKEFVELFTPPRIKNLSPEEYFLGPDKKDDCIGYELEWATIPLGSIKGGSNAKYGPKEQFIKIKKLLVDLTNYTDEMSIFYTPNGELTDRRLTKNKGYEIWSYGSRQIIKHILSKHFYPLFY